MTWRDQAACSGLDTEMFYAHESAKGAAARERTARRALDVCNSCPVWAACLEDALTHPRMHQHGIRGRTYAEDRVEILRAREAVA